MLARFYNGKTAEGSSGEVDNSVTVLQSQNCSDFLTVP